MMKEAWQKMGFTSQTGKNLLTRSQKLGKEGLTQYLAKTNYKIHKDSVMAGVEKKFIRAHLSTQKKIQAFSVLIFQRN